MYRGNEIALSKVLHQLEQNQMLLMKGKRLRPDDFVTLVPGLSRSQALNILAASQADHELSHAKEVAAKSSTRMLMCIETAQNKLVQGQRKQELKMEAVSQNLQRQMERNSKDVRIHSMRTKAAQQQIHTQWKDV